jgi:site-specific DNA-cytosine methylase
LERIQKEGDEMKQYGDITKLKGNELDPVDLIVVGSPCQDLSVAGQRKGLEGERLQGYPDGWTDIPGASDSKRYKALGNSIALPFWEHLAHRFVEIGNVQSIGSLFDGIGGFPLVFHRAGAETKWTSEIEPFCEEVVRIRFGE